MATQAPPEDRAAPDREISTSADPVAGQVGILDPERHYGPIKDTLDPEVGGALSEDDMFVYVGAAITDSQETGGNRPSYNELVETGIVKIVTQLFAIDTTTKNVRLTGDNSKIDHFGIVVRFPEAEILRPTQPEHPSGKMGNLYPNKARSRGTPYLAPLSMSATVKITAHYGDGRTEEKSADIPRFEVAQFPIMVGSKRCHTYKLTREARKQIQEDPTDQGGYFIAKGGGEWSVELLENIRFNSLHVYLGLGKEQVRGEFISQPGGAFEHSSQVIVRLAQTGLLSVEINSMKFQKAQIPFYLIFRLFGVASDMDILSHIVGDLENPSPVDQKIIDIVDKALHMSTPTFEVMKDELNRQKLIEGLAAILERFVTRPNSYNSDENAVRFLTTRLLSVMDTVLLPHVGLTPDSRIPKLRYLGLLIYKTMLTLQGVTPPTDRDSFVMKRVHGAGVSLAKAFKTTFNQSVITTLVSAIRQELKQMDFAKITPQRLQETTSAMFNVAADLTRLLIQSLTGGNKILIIRRRAIVNRLASSALERKNPLNVFCAGRKIITPGASAATKGTDRAEKIRAVHPKSTGFICPYHSADTGEEVGLGKQMACTATVCSAGLIHPLKMRLASDPEIVSAHQYSNHDIKRMNLARIFVNGDWIGCCKKPWDVTARYRGYRRLGQGITPQTTICWNVTSNEIEFWLDVGRISRPLLIVDNNLKEYDAAALKAAEARIRGDKDWEKHTIPFIQNVRYSKKHARGLLAGTISLQDLLKQGICEYICPEEVENCLLAESIETLYSHRHNVLKRFTHCDVPQAICGLAALSSPDANHTQPARITYQTNQGRSACGWYSLAWPFRTIDQLRFFQYYNEHPLVTTLSGNFIMPSGMNALTAYISYRGNNQEDSAMVKQDFVQSGGYGGCLIRRLPVTLEKNEIFGTPSEDNTSGMKAASYAELEDGLIRIGTEVKSGTVVVGRMVRETTGPQNRRGRGQATGTTSFIDRSIVYHENDSARVDDAYVTQGPEDAPMALIKYIYDKPLSIGDKMCLTKDHEAWCRRYDSAACSHGRASWVPIHEVGLRDLVAVPDTEIRPSRITELQILRWVNPTKVYAFAGGDGLYQVMCRLEPKGERCCLCVATGNHVMVCGDARRAGILTFRKVEELNIGDFIVPGPRSDPSDGLLIEVAEIVAFAGEDVYCLEVPQHVFIVRHVETAGAICPETKPRYGPAHWTHNSSRAGNKGIVAQIMPECDLPYDEDGNRPDFLVNPHGIPTRMVVGQETESTYSLACARTGTTMDATPFRRTNIRKFMAEVLTKLGFRENGHRRMFSAITGRWLDYAVFMAPTYLQRLQKFVDNNRYWAPAKGPTDALTGQPLDGKSQNGGLRLGEMEIWVLCAQALMHILDLKIRRDSDGRTGYYCRNCGQPADYNASLSIYNCPECGELTNIVAMPTCQAAIVFHHELRAIGVDIRFDFGQPLFESSAPLLTRVPDVFA